MTKFISVIPLDNYILQIVTDDNRVLKFDVLAELKRIPSYNRLYDVDFFKQVHYKNERIYWDYDHDFHIDQVIAKAKK
ncbi:MAG: DUF2442 domain-containing protein [Burkholderiales bacterium]|nr:DUF2442 domain-containing protein [Burkholderiales bacterium]